MSAFEGDRGPPRPRLACRWFVFRVAFIVSPLCIMREISRIANEIMKIIGSFSSTSVGSLVVRLEEKIDALCDLRGWSNRQLAIEAGVAPSSLLSALNGHEIGVRKAISIARLLDVPVEWLFDDAKEAADLKHRPFWLPPGLDLHAAIVYRDLENDLDDYVRERHGIPAVKRRNKPSPQASTDPHTPASRKRRKSAGGEG